MEIAEPGSQRERHPRERLHPGIIGIAVPLLTTGGEPQVPVRRGHQSRQRAPMEIRIQQNRPHTAAEDQLVLELLDDQFRVIGNRDLVGTEQTDDGVVPQRAGIVQSNRPQPEDLVEDFHGIRAGETLHGDDFTEPFTGPHFREAAFAEEFPKQDLIADRALCQFLVRQPGEWNRRAVRDHRRSGHYGSGGGFVVREEGGFTAIFEFHVVRSRVKGDDVVGRLSEDLFAGSDMPFEFLAAVEYQDDDDTETDEEND